MISWNINGIRAGFKKGLADFIQKEEADIYCFQETKAISEQVPLEFKKISGYHSYFSSPVKKGYSGVAVYSKSIPPNVTYSIGKSRFDEEGRVIALDMEKFLLLNIYFPNGGASPARLNYKMDFYDHFLKTINHLRSRGNKIIFCGDINTAHNEIDLARPKSNHENAGFTDQERAGFSRILAAGFLDSFRQFHKEGGHYTWWSYIFKAREKNVGWRIDYFGLSEALRSRLEDAFILEDVMGSDHCPVGIIIDSS